MLRRSLEIRHRVLGADHLETNGTKTNLASVAAAQGDYERALALFKEAEESSAHHSSEQDRRLASCRSAANYGRCFTQLGQFADARSSLIQSRKLLSSGTDNPLYRRAIMYCFGNLALAEQNFEEARANYKDCLNGFGKEIVEKNHLMTCGCHYKLAQVEVSLGNDTEAL